MYILGGDFHRKEAFPQAYRALLYKEERGVDERGRPRGQQSARSSVVGAALLHPGEGRGRRGSPCYQLAEPSGDLRSSHYAVVTGTGSFRAGVQATRLTARQRECAPQGQGVRQEVLSDGEEK